MSASSQQDARRLRRSIYSVIYLLVGVWLIAAADHLLGLELVRFGVDPRSAGGLRGILLAPFIHGSFAHLFANSAPLLVLGATMLYAYPRAALFAIPAIILVSGGGVWLFGREHYHIGASGLTYGLMFYIFTVGILRRDRRAIALACLVFFLYGGMIWGIFPGQDGISFEYHLFGAISGIALAFMLKKLDPGLPVKHYDWEGQDEDDTQLEAEAGEADDGDHDRQPRFH